MGTESCFTSCTRRKHNNKQAVWLFLRAGWERRGPVVGVAVTLRESSNVDLTKSSFEFHISSFSSCTFSTPSNCSFSCPRRLELYKKVYLYNFFYNIFKNVVVFSWFLGSLKVQLLERPAMVRKVRGSRLSHVGHLAPCLTHALKGYLALKYPAID